MLRRIDEAKMTEPTSPSTATDPVRSPPRKKRGRKHRSRETPPKRPALDAQGRERPPFLLAFPDDAELNRLVAAFERGDYQLVRRESEQLAEVSSRPEVRRAARELRRRIDPDPLARFLLFVACGLFAFLLIWTYWPHGH